MVEEVVKEEGEAIVSWILNIPDEDCKYEDKSVIQYEWEEIASPEVGYLEKFYQFSDEESEISVMRLVKEFKEKYQQNIKFDQMAKTLKSLGYVVRFNIVKNIEIKPIKKVKNQENL